MFKYRKLESFEELKQDMLVVDQNDVLLKVSCLDGPTTHFVTARLDRHWMSCTRDANDIKHWNLHEVYVD